MSWAGIGSVGSPKILVVRSTERDITTPLVPLALEPDDELRSKKCIARNEIGPLG